MINHEKYIRQTFELALKGLGHTSPNPMVGAVLVRDDKILGIGFHQKYGSAKAEVNAILDAKAQGFELEGATLYCNLEPSTCVQQIIEEKISKVVISNLDLGKNGAKNLCDHGIEVVTNILEDEGLRLNEVYFKFAQTNIPFIHLNLASKNESSYVHGLRQKYDCVIVGRKTIEQNDPSLTNRSTEFSTLSQPLRIVVGKLQNLNLDWKILNDQFRRNTMIITTDEDVRNNSEIAHFLEQKAVALLAVKKNEDGGVDLNAMLKSLAGLKFTSILVEGGPMLAKQFLNASLVDVESLDDHSEKRFQSVKI
jgi:diaminohydroxyphosphoribosylaminopyrimidine deaminase/5-amino-6-(5-phosphoribosylamino)uracil reductase